MKVQHTVKWHYGTYSGITTVICDADDDMDVVTSIVKRIERLNFLAMCSENYKVIDTKQLDWD